MPQFERVLVCQFCGRAAARKGAKHWLNQPHRDRWDVRIVRCPEHWSEWALRHTRDGRTNANRAAMKEALDLPPPKDPPWLAPFPTGENW